jgi:ectoine hydroxylase-related dioxygenase (phytanoyl-CoA dioxygenase family)
LDRSDPELQSFVRDSRIASIVSTLHNHAPIDYLNTQVLFKQPGTPFAKHAWNLHQDNHYVRHPYGMGVSAITALEDSGPDNGGMIIYPGSHILPILPHEQHESFNPDQNPGDRCELPEKYRDKEMDLCLKQGDLYIQHGNLIHGSYPNNSPHRSRTHFGISCIVRGQPYSRTGQNSNRMPQPLTLEKTND